MTQFPNDPGPDRQPQVSYAPEKVYSVITEKVFTDGMELQTKYAYECSRQLAEESLAKAKELCDQIAYRLQSTDTNLDGLAADVARLREYLTVQIQAINKLNDDQSNLIHDVQNQLTLHMDSYDYNKLVNQVLERS